MRPGRDPQKENKVPFADLSYFSERCRGGFSWGVSYYLLKGNTTFQRCFLLGSGYFEVMLGSTLRDGRPGDEMEARMQTAIEGWRGGLF